MADVQLGDELVANPEGHCRGVVLEANLDTGRGPVATVIVENGTLRVGDTLVAGAAWGRVRALIDDKGDNVKEALPSMPVQVLGLNDVPAAGDEFRVADDKAAKALAEHREQRHRFAGLASTAAATGGGAKLEDIFEQIQRGETATLNVILKADVHGSLEAVTRQPAEARARRSEARLRASRRRWHHRERHPACGDVGRHDHRLQRPSRPQGPRARRQPRRRDPLYEIIYKLLEDLEAAMVGMLKPEYEEVVTGEAEVRAALLVARRQDRRLLRADAAPSPATPRCATSARAWSSGRERSRRCVASRTTCARWPSGFECAMILTGYTDLKEGDVVETYEDREIPRV